MVHLSIYIIIYVSHFEKICLNMLNKILRYGPFSFSKSIFDKTIFEEMGII